MSHVKPASRSATLRLVGAALVLAAAGVGCGTGGLPASSPPAATRDSPPSPPAAQSPAPSSVAPTPVPVTATPAGPPSATLSGTATGPSPGTLGSYTWADSGTDAPWIVPRDGSGASPGSRLEVAFEPAATPASWTARWAPVAGSSAGDVARGVDGTGRVAITAPAEAGTWSLQLEASFGQARGATWYWRLEVGP